MSANIDSLVKQLAKLAIENKVTICCAESCTGGLLAKHITDFSGSSQWFTASLVTYSNQAKHRLLGVSMLTLETYGAVSEEIAEEMAFGAEQVIHADLSIAITGIAGPLGGTMDKPVGTVCFALFFKKKLIKKATKLFSGDRSEIRKFAVKFALTECINCLQN